jgi:hypothetical protein
VVSSRPRALSQWPSRRRRFSIRAREAGRMLWDISVREQRAELSVRAGFTPIFDGQCLPRRQLHTLFVSLQGVRPLWCWLSGCANGDW